jgi:uncharacterized protein YdhG (YjbR/CyaY superfamily)
MRTDVSYTTIDEYIALFSEPIQQQLARIREVIRENAPAATEAIKYGMPAFVLRGNMVYFAAFKNHISFFPTPSGINAFRDELATYPVSKGTIQFPLLGEIPYELIGRIVQFRVQEQMAKKGN